MIIGYARVSTDGQTLEAQIDQLRASGVELVFQEKISGARADRPELMKLLALVKEKDVVVVTRLDRLARSTRDLLNIMATLSQKGVGFTSIADKWADTTTAHGRLMLTILGGLAEFERELIKARTTEGRERAKARGQHMGRPAKLTEFQRKEAEILKDQGESISDIARHFNVHHSTISRICSRG